MFAVILKWNMARRWFGWLLFQVLCTAWHFIKCRTLQCNPFKFCDYQCLSVYSLLLYAVSWQLIACFTALKFIQIGLCTLMCLTHCQTFLTSSVVRHYTCWITVLL